MTTTLTSDDVKRLTGELAEANEFADMWSIAFPELQAPSATLGMLEAKGYHDGDVADLKALSETFLRYRDRYDPVRGSYDPRKASTFASVWLEERGKVGTGAKHGTGTNGAGGSLGRSKQSPAEVVAGRSWRRGAA